MFDLDHWREILNALGTNKMRTALTAFGVFWGIFMLVIMLGSGKGLENGTTEDFADGATNSFYVWTRATSKAHLGLPPGRRFELNNGDIQAIRDHVPEVEVVAPRLQLGGFSSGNNVSRRNKAGAFSVMGDYPEIRVIESVRMETGRFLNRLDLAENRKVAVIGTRVRRILFDDDEEPIGEHIRINGVYFKVVGVFRTSRSGEQADRDTERIHIPFTTFQRAFNVGDEVGWFALTSRADLPASEAEEKVLALMAKRHRVAPDDTRAFGHYNTEEDFNKVQGLFAGIRLLIWIVGSGTLAAGVIGVSNIMLVIVKERTHELGIRRAVGATPISVMRQIVLESVLLTSVAGYLGLVGGILLVEVTSRLIAVNGANSMFNQPEVDLATALKALTILVISGTLAGLIPAQRAVSVTPVQALRAQT